MRGLDIVYSGPVAARLAQGRAIAEATPLPGFSGFYLISVLLLMGAFLFLNYGYRAGFSALNSLSPVIDDSLWQNLTVLGETQMVLAATLIFAWRRPEIFFSFFAAAALAGLLVGFMKFNYALPRPSGALNTSEFFLIGPAFRLGSFPSGHTTAAFAFAAVLVCYARLKRTQFLLLTVAVAIGLSRVIVGAHWPADVLGGAIGGLIAGWLGVSLVRTWPRLINRFLFHFFVLSAVICLIWVMVDDLHYPESAWARWILAIIVIFSVWLALHMPRTGAYSTKKPKSPDDPVSAREADG